MWCAHARPDALGLEVKYAPHSFLINSNSVVKYYTKYYHGRSLTGRLRHVIQPNRSNTAREFAKDGDEPVHPTMIG